VLEFHRTGKLRLLAITNPTRIPIAPDIPTAVEAGVDAAVSPVPDWTTDNFYRFMETDIARWSPLVKAIGVRLD